MWEEGGGGRMIEEEGWRGIGFIAIGPVPGWIPS